MYVTGEGIVQDLAEAARLFQLAADEGHAEAQYTLYQGGMHGAGSEGLHRKGSRAPSTTA